MKTAIVALLVSILPTLASASLNPTLVKMTSTGFIDNSIVVVDTKGILTILSARTPNETPRVVAEVQLKQKTIDQISAMAFELSFAKLKQTHNPFVCQSLVAATLTSLDVSAVDQRDNSTFTGRLHTVLSSESCTVADHLLPVDASLLESAHMVKAILQILASENARN